MKPVVPAAEKKGRIEALDALRGFAALCVFLTHAYGAWPGRDPSDWINTFPLLVLINQTAPIIFFTLSGYVMALPFFGPRPPAWLPFALKRLTRLYIPLAAATLLTAFLYYISGADLVMIRSYLWGVPPFYPYSPSHVEFTQPFASQPLNNFLLLGNFIPEYLKFEWHRVVDQLLMTGTEQTLTLNTVAWSLVHEIRISLIFPLLILLCRRTGWALFVSIALFIIGSALVIASGHSNKGMFVTDSFAVTWLFTMRFVLFFVAGILLVKHRDFIGRVIGKIPPAGIGTLWLIVVGLLCMPPYHCFDPVFGTAAALALVLCVHSPGTQRFFRATPLPAMGRISYSFYLIHLPLLFIIFQLLPGLPGWGKYALLLSSALLLATLLYHFVEVPSSRLGRRLAANLSAPKGNQESEAVHVSRSS